MSTSLSTFELQAFNTATASENKIHDDAVAASFGFSGGLVPGVEVYAYLCHPAIKAWGERFLTEANVSVHFAAPIYDGDVVEVRADVDEDGTLRAEAISRGSVQATLKAVLRPAPVVPPKTSPAPLPTVLPKASPAAFEPGIPLGSFSASCGRADLVAYLDEVRDPASPVFELGFVHPGWLLRQANEVLIRNVLLGPWIHVGSTIDHLRPLPIGDVVRMESQVNRHYEHKGHRFVVVDLVIQADDGPPIASIQHTAIYEPRQVRERVS